MFFNTQAHKNHSGKHCKPLDTVKMEHTAQKNIEEWCSTVNTESSYGQEEWFAPNMTKLVEEWCSIYMKSSVQSRRGVA